MKSAKDIERALAQADLDVEVNAGTDRQTLDDLIERNRQSTEGQLTLWRKMMRSPIVKLTPAAALIAIVAVWIAIWQGPSTPAYGLDQTIQAMADVQFIHVLQRDATGSIQEERWIEVGPDGRQIRYRHDRPPNVFVIQNGDSVARYDHPRKTVTLYAYDAMPYRWIGPLRETFENLREEGMIIAENVPYRGRRVHTVWWPMMRSVCYVDPDTRLPIAIGDLELSYETPPAQAFDIFTPSGYEAIREQHELETPDIEGGDSVHAKVEFSSLDEAGVKIVTQNNTIKLHQKAPGTYEGHVDIGVQCEGDIAWAISITRTARISGDYSCSMQEFGLSALGGVTTVSAMIRSASPDKEPPVGHVATVKLSPMPLPEPDKDAHACLTLGFALYDAQRYEDALVVFERMAKATNAEAEDRAVAVTWQGHMLDLLGKREEAIARYREVVAMGLDWGVRHDQYGLSYDFTPYAQERMEMPFTHLKNRDQH